MSSRALVVEIMKSDQDKGRGTFDFVELPRLGDRVLLASPLGDLEVLEVLKVEHHPAMSEPDTEAAKWRAEQGPMVFLYVKYLSTISKGPNSDLPSTLLDG
jgi:hypothetical protein